MAREVEARLRLSAIDRTAKAFDSVQRRLSAAERQVGAYGRAHNAVSQTVQRAESAMVAYAKTAGVVAVGAGFAGVIKAATDFESRLTGIQKKLGITNEEVAALGKEARDLATSGEVAVPLEEILAGYERGAAAGLPLAELREFATLSAKAADAFEMSAEDVGNAAAGFRVSMDIPISEMERYFDLINGLADSGISDERDIVDFVDRAGASLKNFGLAKEDIAALGSTLLNLKMPAEVGARAMSTLTTKLLVPEGTKKSKGAFDELYDGADKFTKLLKKDSRGALLDFLKRIRELDKFKQAEILTDILGQGFSDEVQRLSGGLDELVRNLEYVDGKTWFGSLSKSYALKLDDLSSQWQGFKNQIGELAIEVGLRGLPLLKSGLEEARQIIAEIDENIESFHAKVDLTEFEHAKAAIEELGSSVTRFLQIGGTGDTPIEAVFNRLASAADAVTRSINLGRDLAERAGLVKDDNEPAEVEQKRATRVIDDFLEWNKVVGTGYDALDSVFNDGEGRRGRKSRIANRNANQTPNGLVYEVGSEKGGRVGKVDPQSRIDAAFSTPNLTGERTAGPDPDSLRQAMEGGGASAQSSIEAAARSINEQGAAGGSAFVNMLAGMTQMGRDAGAAFGDAAVAAINSKLRIPLPNGASTTGRPSGQLATGNLGRTMPAAGTTASGAEKRVPGGQP